MLVLLTVQCQMATSDMMFTPRIIRISRLYLVTGGNWDTWTWYHENVLAYKIELENSFLSLTHLPGIPAAHPSSCHSLKEPLSQGPSLTRHAKLSVPPEMDANTTISYIKLLCIRYSNIQHIQFKRTQRVNNVTTKPIIKHNPIHFTT
jgi:hypothetical protein